jgi:DNA helicase-2/ATP-dependent DNA helicase PcrA
VKDALSLLRWADNPKNRIAAFRALQLLPGIGPAAAAKCFDAFEANAHAWASLRHFAPPALAREAWPVFAALMADLAVPEGPWQGQMGRVREWYEPQLARLHDAAEVRAGDLLQLERVAQQFGTRERFLSELALDPAQASGDLAGSPMLDEDYLILSTIHSAKGQEWDAVHLLNVADGNFPSEFSTGRAELIEEERRLLYVAMTRAKTELDLIAPLKYYVTQQSRTGDRHVYGAKSRFLTSAVMDCLDPVAWGEAETTDAPAGGKPDVDVAQKLRGLWS